MTLLRRFLRSDLGTATVEFVIAVPLVLSLLFASIDFGAVMLRQVFLDRAVDMAMREVRLGNVPSNGIATLRNLICQRTILLGNCTNSLTIELRPINTNSWNGLQSTAQCINRSANITPNLTFNPSAGSQDLMLVRVCATVDPFLRITGMVMGMGSDNNGDLYITSLGAFTTEPS